MSKKTKTEPTDSEETATSEPTIEEVLDAMSTAFLGEVDAVGKKYARSLKTNWHGITPTGRLGLARQVRIMVQTGLRNPVSGADPR